MITAVEKLVLKMVSDHNSQWTWYQLERAISRNGNVNVDAIVVADSLTNRSLLTAVSDPRYPHPVYEITELGKAALLSD